MGLPEINIYFKQAADTAIKRSGQGIVALILRDATALEALKNPSSVYDDFDKVNKTHYTDENYDYIKKTFLGSPKRVLVEHIGEEDALEAVLSRLKNKKWNYLAMPSCSEEEAKELADFIAAQRNNKKTFKAVMNYEANDPGVINFATGGIVAGDKTYTAMQYAPRIAGLLAGLSFNDYERASATYATLAEVTAIEESVDPDKDINAGKLILINDGSGIKIGRAVNSLAQLSDGQKEEMKKIRIVEIMDLIRDDIHTAYSENYVGKFANNYDNKLLFVNEVNQYFKRLADNDILEREYENIAFINVEAQRKWLAEKSDVSNLTDEQIKKAKTGSKVFLGGNILAVDAMEDLDMAIGM